MERVIFRIEKNPYDTNNEYYLAVFPDTFANPGRYACIPFHFDLGGRAIFEPFGECSMSYYYSTKCVHKNTTIAERCKKAVEEYYGESFRVMEKIM